MKLFATFAALVSADLHEVEWTTGEEWLGLHGHHTGSNNGSNQGSNHYHSSIQWNGVSSDNTCGMQFSGDSMINATCTVSGSNAISYIFAGNGAFITGTNTFTGYDGTSGDVDVVVFFEQDCSSGECDNFTCWDASVSCTPNGAATDGVFFMETVNDHRGAKGGNINLQIYGVKAGDVLAIDLAGFACQNISAPFGSVNADQDAWGNMFSDSGAFSVTADETFGGLFQISITQQPGQTSSLNLWESTVFV